MRSVHGHYYDLKAIEESCPPWAKGCDQCSYGLLGAQELIKVLTLAEQRSALAAEELLVFCTCRAGNMQRQNLRKVYNAMPVEQRRSLREFVVRTPTIHYESEAA